MAVVNLIPPGTVEATADIVVPSGSSVSLSLMQTTNGAGFAGCAAQVLYAGSSAGTFFPFGLLDANNPVAQIAGPLTLRVVRRAGRVSFGVDQNT